MRIAKITFSSLTTVLPKKAMSQMFDFLPADAEIFRFEHGQTFPGEISILITSKDFKEVVAGDETPQIEPCFRKDYPENWHCEKIDFHDVLETPSTIPTFVSPNSLPVSHKTCSHRWAFYRGIVEIYEYCADCGVKK